jgi:PPM family protein phosphatase
MKIESFSVGSKHYDNEDRLAVRNMGIFGVSAVLADGMGGLSLGDMAAEVVTSDVADYILCNYQGYDERNILHKALAHADKELRNVSMTHKSNMGVAIAAVIVIDNCLYCTWQGNVRVYVGHGNKVNLITEDHIAHIGYGRIALTRCIKGGGLRDDIPFVSRKLNDGDKVFLCTDGFYNVAEGYMTDIAVEEIKKKIGAPEDDASLIKIS